MEILYQLHPLSIVGLVLFLAGALILVLLFFSNELSYGGLKLKGNIHRTKKWPVMQKLATWFLVSGAITLGVGFALPEYDRGRGLSERTWYGIWSIQFQGNPDFGTPLSIAETVRFYHYSVNGEGIFEAEIKDGENSRIGSFQRLEPNAGEDNFRVVKGQFKINGGRTIQVELALLGNKEVFSGIVYESKSAKRQTCWRKKQ